MDSTIYLVNQTTNVTDAQAQQIAAACSIQLARDLAPAYGVLPSPVVLVKTPPTQQACVITLVDTQDDPEALGWHTDDGAEHIYGVVGTRVVLDQGAQVLTGSYAVSTIVSHEVMEMFIDLRCNLWADSGQGYLVAYEVGDPVQSDYYEINGVAVSNFVFPGWFSPHAAPGEQLDYLKTLSAPFQIARGGYIVKLAEGQSTQQFGEAFPEFLKAAKATEVSRTQRISRGQPS